jgi:flagellar hook-associated protein 1
VSPVSNLLNIGWSALSTHRTATEVAGHNVANAATPGYNRQRVEIIGRQGTMTGQGMLGDGVEALGIRNQQDEMLESRLIMAQGEEGYYYGRSRVLSAAETAIGIGEEDGVAKSLADLFSSFKALSDNPSGMAERQQVLSSAENFAYEAKRVRTALENSRSALDTDITGLTEDLQQKVKEIASLNKQIRDTEIGGAQANDLRDRRALLARQVGEILGVRTSTDQNGSLNLSLTGDAGGGMLVEGENYATIQATADPANNGLKVPTITWALGGQQALGTSCSGMLGGLLSARDTDVKGSITALDTLAYNVATEVNRVHSLGVGLQDATQRNLFDAAGLATVDGAAARLALDPTMVGHPENVAAGAAQIVPSAALPGDNQNAKLLADIGNTNLFGGMTASSYWRSQVSDFGTNVAAAQQNYNMNRAAVTQLENLRQSTSGVSIDEEMIQLTMSQRAFEAASKLIQTGDQLLQTIISLKS